MLFARGWSGEIQSLLCNLNSTHGRSIFLLATINLRHCEVYSIFLNFEPRAVVIIYNFSVIY